MPLFPQLIMMAGYPCSGKSTFSIALESKYNIIRVDQDENPQKGECENLVINGLNKNHCVVLDRCHITKKDRKYWLDIANRKKTWCIFFNISLDECRYRMSKRENHPSIKENETGLSILKSVEGILEEPTLDEGFEKIIKLNSVDEINDLFKLYDLDIPKKIDY